MIIYHAHFCSNLPSVVFRNRHCIKSIFDPHQIRIITFIVPFNLTIYTCHIKRADTNALRSVSNSNFLSIFKIVSNTN